MSEPGPQTLALIEIGTNSCKFVVAHMYDEVWEVVDFHRRTTRIGRALDRDGRISRTGLNETARAVREFTRSLPRDIPRFAYATYALRRAANRRAVLEALSTAARCPVRVLGGREEARFAYLSALRAPGRCRAVNVVIDVGGGSTEVIVGRGERILSAHSLPLGALFLTRRFLEAEPLDAAALDALQTHVAHVAERTLSRTFPDGWRSASMRLVASGGSSTSLVTMAAALRGRPWRGGRWPPPPHLLRVRTVELRRLVDRCMGSTTARRRRWSGLDPDRAAIIPGGLAIIRGFAGVLRKRVVDINPGGVREGALTHLLENGLRW